MNIQQIKITDYGFPDTLKNIPFPPKQLYYTGNLDLLSYQILLSIVGSRRVSIYGRECTYNIAFECAGQGIGIVSGLALGVDAIAHRACLDAGGVAIAVLACGLDKLYPATNARLGQEILNNGGLIISEYAEGTEPFPGNFIARNRLVSGLSRATLITEAAKNSGTLHTSRFAMEQGKTVMAVPGNITSPTSAATNHLLRTGAEPITGPGDVLAFFGLTDHIRRQTVKADNPDEAALIKLLKQGMTDAADLMSHSFLGAASFNQTLTMLEINGKIRPLGAGHWSLN